jgi:hypothetical protein
MERNPYSPPSAPVNDLAGPGMKTPWGRAIAFYWAYCWRAALAATGACLPVVIFFSLLGFALSAWPLFVAPLLIVCVLAALAFASIVALRWATESIFGGYSLRAVDTTDVLGPRLLSSEHGIPLRYAGRLYLSQLWRYLLVQLPVNFTLGWLLVGPGALTARDWSTVLRTQSINLVTGFIVGVWAMRAALRVAYSGFRFQWIAAETSDNSKVSETRPSSV